MLCWYALFAPVQLERAHEEDSRARNNYSDKADPTPKSTLVRKAFWSSLALVVISGGVGAIVSTGAGLLVCTTHVGGIWLEVIGILLLLWATVFVRGWEIQTWAGVTLVERVNRWLYLGLACIGTVVLVGSLFVTPCRP
jgi:hypothetical protein